MADVVAQPVPQVEQMVIPPGMGINNLFDWSPILGVPLWLFVTCVLFFCIAAVWVYWFARMRKLNAVSGWRESLQRMMPTDVQVWLITRTQSLIIGCMAIEDNVLSYHDKSKIGMWHHNTRESVIRVGGNPAVVVSEDYDQTRDFISEIALTDSCDEFNKDQQQFIDETKKDNPEEDNPNIVKPISNYDDYAEYGHDALQLRYPSGPPIKSYNVFNNSRFLKYFPRGCTHMFFGGELQLDARGLIMHRKEQSWLSKHTFLIVAAIVVFAAIGAAWFVPLG